MSGEYASQPADELFLLGSALPVLLHKPGYMHQKCLDGIDAFRQVRLHESLGLEEPGHGVACHMRRRLSLL